MYRIISGNLKGKRITAPKNFDLRPTTDFAKEGLFNILENKYDFSEISVLDLFAGIGSISFEFISRGVPLVQSVEKNYRHAKFIEKTAQELGLSDAIEVYTQDVFQFLDNHTSLQYDLIFADAPFAEEKSIYERLTDFILGNQMTKEEGLLVLEHNSKLKLDEIIGFQQTRKYGNISFSFFTP